MSQIKVKKKSLRRLYFGMLWREDLYDLTDTSEVITACLHNQRDGDPHGFRDDRGTKEFITMCADFYHVHPHLESRLRTPVASIALSLYVFVK